MFCTMLVAFACGAAPAPIDDPETAPNAGGEAEASPSRRKSASPTDDCAVTPGKPPPKPLEKQYTGVAKAARCQREVYTIMGGLTHFLGVKCNYCHVEPDYAKMTHRKHVANWMARELIPALQKQNGGGEIWCNDCHVVRGKGTAKILGSPRNQRWAVEWMTTHMVDEFDRADGGPLRCKDCHQGQLGSREFQPKIILTDRVPGAPRAADAPDAAAPAPAPPPPTISADAGGSEPDAASGTP